MTSGVYERSQQHKDKLRNAMKLRKKRLGYINSPESREKMRAAALNMTEEHKFNLSKAKIGKKNTKKHIEKIRTARLQKNNYVAWNKGLSKETDERVKAIAEKQKLKREIRFCKCGCGFSKEVAYSSDWQFKSGHNCGMKGEIHSKETRKKQRLSAIKRIEQNFGVAWPNYNPKACEYFKSFDENNNTKGHYAMYGGGEYKVEELGYWPDYINFEKKLIMEFDEPYHYDENGNLKQKDLIRQKEIQEHFPDFKFERIKEDICAKQV